jgi:hypothetical protein
MFETDLLYYVDFAEYKKIYVLCNRGYFFRKSWSGIYSRIKLTHYIGCIVFNGNLFWTAASSRTEKNAVTKA